MSKLIAGIILTVILTSCARQGGEILGKWRVSNQSYKAVYEIKNGEEGMDCSVVSYYDGTSRLGETANRPMFLFKGSNKVKGAYIDGISGATKKKSKSKPKTYELRLRGKDSLDVLVHIGNQQRKEVWIRE